MNNKGSIALNLAVEQLRVFMQWQRAIVDESVMVEPETEPHVTIVQGVDNDVDTDAVMAALRNAGGVAARVLSIVVLKNVREDVDAVALELESKEIIKIRELIEDAFGPDQSPYTYRPHITLAYVMAGTHDFADGIKTNGLVLWFDELRVRRNGESEQHTFQLNEQEEEPDD